jgi:hypothetical protein
MSARRQEAEDSREENGIPTPAIGANATNFHHPGAGSVQITKKASPWAGLLCFVFLLLEAVPSSDPMPSSSLVERAGKMYFHLLFILVSELVDEHVHTGGDESRRLLMG